MTGLLGDYSRQAAGYDGSRTAGPRILTAVVAALDGAPGRRVLDIGGGTGNYAAALERQGWRVLLVDRSPEMIARAAAKGLSVLCGEAQSLPVGDASFDAAIMVSMLHHVEDPDTALAEARRALRPGGRLCVVAFAREDVEGLWLLDRFPSSRPWMLASHPPRDSLVAALPGAVVGQIVIDGVEDGCLAALAGRPDLLLDESRRRATSFFERMERDHPDELATGMDRLRVEVAAGTAPRQPGTVSVIEWTA